MPFFYGGMWIFPMFMPLIVGIVIYLLYKNDVFNGMCHPMHNGDSQDNTPLEILKKRYAAGEISKEEYLQIKSDLTN